MGKEFSWLGRLLCLLIGTLLVWPGLAAAAANPEAKGAAEPGKVMFILDASGSMWGQVKGKAKIAIAKEVMKKLADGLPDGMVVGLMAYGHRREGDCGDIETLLMPGPLNRKAFKAKVDAIKPKGKTPLSEAVRQAAQAMRYTDQRATVVLVSDGLETCAADPCAVAAELAKVGVEFTVHVIGFAISRDEQEHLRCLADRTGGLFLAADDAAGLQAALARTMEKVKEAPKPVVQDPGQATLQGPAQVPVGQVFQVKWQGPDNQGDYIAMALKGSQDSEYAVYAYARTGNPVRLTAPGEVGDYELRYVHGPTGKVIGRAPIKATPVQSSLQAPASVEAARQIEVKWAGPGYRGDYVSIAQPDQQPGEYLHYTYVSQGNPLKLQAPAEPGEYEVRYILGAGQKLIAKAAIQVTPASAQVQAPAEANAAQKIKVSWTGPGNQGDYISIASPDQDPGEYLHYTYVNAGNPLMLQAPAEPGTYEVRYILGLDNKLLAKAPIEIKAVGASVQAPAEASAAQKIKVSWTGPGSQGDYISIARADQDPGSYEHYTYVNTGNPLLLQAPAEPGQYEVRYILGLDNKLLAKAAITIKAVGASVQAPAEASAAQKIKVSWTGPGSQGDYISIARADQDPGSYQHYTYVNTGNPLLLQAPAEPGQYEVRYILGLDNKLLAKAAITIKAVSASVSPPAAADMGSQIKVSWTGPGNQGDYISVARDDHGSDDYVHYSYARTGNPVTLQAPAKPGQYEVRYILGLDNKLLAKAPIEIKAVSATLQAPASVAPDAKFKVTWKGPAYKGDYISIASPDQEPDSYRHYTYVRTENPLTLQAPAEPGQYEVRYIMREGNTLLAKVPIEVKKP